MTDNDRCRLIAEWETGLKCDPDFGEASTPPDYPHDLNATMCAARKLPRGWGLVVDSTGEAWIRTSTLTPVGKPSYADDPARAAFLALSQYLAERKP